MLRMLLVRFWPVILPIAAYALWLFLARRKARKAGVEKIPKLGDGPWFSAVISAAFIMIALFLYLGFSAQKGTEYVPSHVENGSIIPGYLKEPAP